MFERLRVSSVAIVGVKIISALKKTTSGTPGHTRQSGVHGHLLRHKEGVQQEESFTPNRLFLVSKSILLREEHLDRIKLEGGKALILFCRDGHPAFSHA